MKSFAFTVLGSNQPIYHICCGVNPLHYSQSAACLGLSDSSFIISYTTQQPLPWLNWHDIRQSSHSKFEVKVGGSCCSLSQLREPSNWKGDSATLFSQRLHRTSETIIGLWTSLFNSFLSTIPSSKSSKDAEVYCSRTGFLSVPRCDSGPHVAPWLRSDRSQLIAKSHSWRRVTVRALSPR